MNSVSSFHIQTDIFGDNSVFIFFKNIINLEHKSENIWVSACASLWRHVSVPLCPPFKGEIKYRKKILDQLPYFGNYRFVYS